MQKHGFFRYWAILSAVLLWAQFAVTQIPGLPSSASPATQAQPVRAQDPLGRETPQSAVLSFIKYSHRGDYATAAKFLDLPPAKQKQDGPQLAAELLALMDTSLLASINGLSTTPTGLPGDSPDPNLEVVGRFALEDETVQLILVRVPQKDAAPVWLVSQQTLDHVPRLYKLAGAPVLDQYFPGFLSDNFFLGIPAGRWVAWMLSIPAALWLGWLLGRIARWLWQLKGHRIPDRWDGIGRPAIIVFGILLHAVFVLIIGIPLFYRVYYFRTLAVLLVVCLAWLGMKVLDEVQARAAFHVSGKRASESFLQLAYHLLKVVVLTAAALAVLALLGFDTRTMLAGLGIGGIAVALAAQKTLENLLGGITLVLDNTIYTGDDCLISDRYVTVTNIGLRSIVATTREGTEISFPNGILAQSSIENLSRRSRILILTTLSLSRECSLEQLQFVIRQVRELLAAHPRIEKETARFRLAGLAGSGYDIELFAYVRGGDMAEFTAIREDILFRIEGIVDSAGAVWTIPAQLSYRSTRQLVDDEKAAEIERTVQGWHDRKESAFPDISARRENNPGQPHAYPPGGSTSPENQFKAKGQS